VSGAMHARVPMQSGVSTARYAGPVRENLVGQKSSISEAGGTSSWGEVVGASWHRAFPSGDAECCVSCPVPQPHV
jgi:hypothetical protein